MANISGTPGNDPLHGTMDDDTILGGTGDDTIRAGAGNDVLIGGAGADRLDGGEGQDTVNYASSEGNWGVTVLLQEPYGPGGGRNVSGGHAQGDHLTSIENVTGSPWNDHIR